MSLADSVKNGPQVTSAKVAHIEAQIGVHEARARKAQDAAVAHRRRATGDGPLAKARRIRADAQATVADRHRAKANKLRTDLAKAKADEAARHAKHVKRTVASTAAAGLTPIAAGQGGQGGRGGRANRPTQAKGGPAKAGQMASRPQPTGGIWQDPPVTGTVCQAVRDQDTPLMCHLAVTPSLAATRCGAPWESWQTATYRSDGGWVYPRPFRPVRYCPACRDDFQAESQWPDAYRHVPGDDMTTDEAAVPTRGDCSFCGTTPVVATNYRGDRACSAHAKWLREEPKPWVPPVNRCKATSKREFDKVFKTHTGLLEAGGRELRTVRCPNEAGPDGFCDTHRTTTPEAAPAPTKGTPAMTASGEAVNIETTEAMLADLKTRVADMRSTFDNAGGSLASAGLNKLANALSKADDALGSVDTGITDAERELAPHKDIADIAQSAGEMANSPGFYGVGG